MIKRTLYYEIKKYLHTKEAIVITGMRQVGKTTLLRQLFDELKNENKIYFDFENPLNRKYFESKDYDSIAKTLEELGLDSGGKAYLFLDEIQFSREIPSIVKYFIDHYKWKFFLTGSSSFYLKNLFSESLAGRKYLFEMFPLSFQEFLELKGQHIPKFTKQATKAAYLTWHKWYKEYVTWGAFPGVANKKTRQDKKKTLEDIFSSYFNKEVMSLGDFKNNRTIRDLIILLLERVGTRLDMSKLANELGVSRVTIKEYINFLEGTYFISLVYPFSKRRDIEIRSTPKIYACDSGFVNTLTQTNFGSVFENAIFHQLRTSGEINYYQKKTGQEIDFIIDKKIAYKVKTYADESDTRKLAKLTKELGLKNRHVVSYKYTDLTNTRYGFQI